MTKVIDSFRGDYAFLSNFYPSPFVWPDVSYPTVEHAFQALKTIDPVERGRVRNSRTPGEAKRRGRAVTLREDWEDNKDSFMRVLVLAKFNQNPDLAKKLVATGDAELIEGNTWGDTYWGMCNGKGKNMLGRILMTVRDELRGLCEEAS